MALSLIASERGSKTELLQFELTIVGNGTPLVFLQEIYRNAGILPRSGLIPMYSTRKQRSGRYLGALLCFPSHGEG